MESEYDQALLLLTLKKKSEEESRPHTFCIWCKLHVDVDYRHTDGKNWKCLQTLPQSQSAFRLIHK